MQVNYHILNNSVVLNFEGKTFNISASDGRYAQVIEAIKAGDYKSIPDIVDIKAQLEKEGFTVENGEVYVDGKVVPASIGEKILQFREDGMPYKYLLKFWDKLKDNPSFNSRQMLYKFLEHNGHPITKNGNFVAYRGVTEDFKDSHTKTFDNSPGSICEMDRDEVDDNPNNTCSSGLHVAAYDYAKNFSSKMVEVEVDPRDVVAVPTDYDGTKMRVCRFKVLQECVQLLDKAMHDHENVYSESENQVINTQYDVVKGVDIELLKRFKKSLKAVAKLLNKQPNQLKRDEWLKAAIHADIPRLNKKEVNKLGGFKFARNAYFS